MVAHRDTNACHDNDRHVKCHCPPPPPPLSIYYPLVRNQLKLYPTGWYLHFSTWFMKNVSISGTENDKITQ